MKYWPLAAAAVTAAASDAAAACCSLQAAHVTWSLEALWETCYFLLHDYCGKLYTTYTILYCISSIFYYMHFTVVICFALTAHCRGRESIL